MQVYYAPDIISNSHTLDKTESKHLIRVLRMKKGSPVSLIDGKGNLFEGIVSDPDPGGCTIEIRSVIRDFEKRNYSLHIAISPLKNPERFEWFVEKAVEIGVDQITPVVCRNTEKPGIRTERIRNIIISAMKQSLKAKETVLNPVTAFDQFIKDNNNGRLMIAHCHSDIERKKISDVYSRGEDAVIIIGPEGDFTKEEAGAAMSNNFTHIDLGTSRLRTETAGVAACHSIYFINQ